MRANRRVTPNVVALSSAPHEPPTNNERLRLAVKQELSDFVKRENEFNVQQRRERAAQLGLDFDQLRRKSATELNNLRRGG
jgi:hypothetical protein